MAYMADRLQRGEVEAEILGTEVRRIYRRTHWDQLRAADPSVGSRPDEVKNRLEAGVVRD